MTRFRTEVIGDATQRGVTIYAFTEGFQGPVRYVGKTIRPVRDRAKSHVWAAKQRPHLPISRWLLKMAARDADWRTAAGIVHLEYVPPGHDWAARERHWIKYYREAGASLLNLTDGGEGLAGHIPSPEARAKISAGLKTGKFIECEVCKAPAWRKLNEIKRGESRFCSRACYQASLRGVSRPVSSACTAKGIAAAAAEKRARTHCKRGHTLSGDNLFLNSSGSRGCKQCRRIHKETYRSKSRG